MIRPKTQLLLLYVTFTCLFAMLSLLIGLSLFWLTFPLSLLLVTLLLPAKPSLKTVQESQSYETLDDPLIITSKMQPESINSPSFENYIHIKKALAKHHKQFPNAKTHKTIDSLKTMESSPH